MLEFFLKIKDFSILSLNEIIPDFFLKEGSFTKRKPTKQDHNDIKKAIEFP